MDDYAQYLKGILRNLLDNISHLVSYKEDFEYIRLYNPESGLYDNYQKTGNRIITIVYKDNENVMAKKESP